MFLFELVNLLDLEIVYGIKLNFSRSFGPDKCKLAVLNPHCTYALETWALFTQVSSFERFFNHVLALKEPFLPLAHKSASFVDCTHALGKDSCLNLPDSGFDLLGSGFDLLGSCFDLPDKGLYLEILWPKKSC